MRFLLQPSISVQKIVFQINKSQPGMAVHTSNSSAQEVVQGDQESKVISGLLTISGTLGLYETLFPPTITEHVYILIYIFQISFELGNSYS